MQTKYKDGTSIIYEIIAYFFMTKTEEKLLKRY